MVTIEFQYKDEITNIPAEAEDKLNEICSKFKQKAEININKINLNFLYSGKVLNLNLTLIQTINRIDKERKIMRIIVIDTENNDDNQNQNIIKSPYIICPICKEHAKFEVNNYKIKIYNCKNGHISDNILLSEFENTKLIDEKRLFVINAKSRINLNHIIKKCTYVINSI